MRTSEERVIVCGCRAWSDGEKLDAVLSRHVADRIVGAFTETIILVHGDCPTGADAMCAEIASKMIRAFHVYAEAHPADWDQHGLAAGPIRNEEMAKLGATICFAFWDGKSKGTLDMIRRCVAHGIPVHIVPMAPSVPQLPKPLPVGL